MSSEQQTGEHPAAETGRSIQGRSGLARWLSAVFSGALDPVRDPAPPVEGPERLARRARFVRHEALDIAAGAGGCVESERVRLLVNAPEGVAAPPYGSWWTEGCLQGRTTRAVAEFYRGEGLEPQPGSGPADYLGAELEFLHFLLQHQHAAYVTRQADLERHGRQRERAFLENHVLSWVPRFCQAGRAATGDRLWLGLFDLLQEFVEDEARRVREAG